VASRDARGYITYVGRADDVFKASDYRISPFELESVLIEPPGGGRGGSGALAGRDPPGRAEGVRRARTRVLTDIPDRRVDPGVCAQEPCGIQTGPSHRVRELPKTISGKIRRVELRAREDAAHGAGSVADSSARASETEFWESDFPGLKD
jgi:acetyl-CoA synthetase